MWPDNDTDRDFVNFTSVVETVAEIVVQAAGRPISIGVSGAGNRQVFSDSADARRAEETEGTERRPGVHLRSVQRVALSGLSGGPDSLVGAIDLVAGGRKPFAISQIVRATSPRC